MTDAGTDALGRLAQSVGRPRSSLTAFSRLSEAQLTVLADAVEATAERRRDEVDAALERALGGVAGRALRLAIGRRRTTASGAAE